MKTKKFGKTRVCVETGKVCFKDVESAQKRISQICSETNQSGKRWGHYKCEFCKRIHLSSGKRKGKQISHETNRRRLIAVGIIR